MKTYWEDPPIGAISAAFRTLAVNCLWAAAIFGICISGYVLIRDRHAPYGIATSQITALQAGRGEHLYVSRGAAGPYRLGPGMTGVVGGGITFVAGDQTVQCPPSPGHYYSARSYLNRDGGAYVLVEKFPEVD